MHTIRKYRKAGKSAIGIFIQNQATQNLVPITEPGTKTQARGKENCPHLDKH